MTDGWLGGDFAREAYDRFADYYDQFNHEYQYEQWTARLRECAEEAGDLDRRRLLDSDFGTGLSFLPRLDRGWEVVACDVAPAMVQIARPKVKRRAEVAVADMRDLPREGPLAGPFDLVWAVNDAINYLLSTDELQSALEHEPQRGLGEAVRSLRDKRRISRQNPVGFSERWITDVEAGRSNPTWANVRRPADGLQIPLDELAKEAMQMDMKLEAADDGPR